VRFCPELEQKKNKILSLSAFAVFILSINTLLHIPIDFYSQWQQVGDASPTPFRPIPDCFVG